MACELDESFKLRGQDVGLEDAEALKVAGFALIDAQGGQITVDFDALVQASSVTVALMMAWYRRATLQQKTIEFVNLSQELRNIIEFSGLSQVLLTQQDSLGE